MGTPVPVNERLTAKEVKQGGVHYTPPELARFLASHVAAHLPSDLPHPRLLDPACGDGELLEALALEMPEEMRARTTFFGMENDPVAIQHATERLRALPGLRFEIIETDFLNWTTEFQQPQIFGPDAWHQPFDAVISNPPYVRTQVMGGKNAQKLATQFGITGRVDLYHAFALAMTMVLRPGGVLGLLCSNRFLSVQSGATLRKALLQDYELHDVFDLGDTKLFGAAVLPAIVIGTKSPAVCADSRFTRIYEDHEAEKGKPFNSVLDAIESGAEGAVHVNDRVFLIERGQLATPADRSEPWRISSPEQDVWLANLRTRAPRTFADLANIRVGVKTTADNVFMRDDWSAQPAEMQPESEVLFPLISNRVAAQWWPLPSERKPKILYTHTTKHGKRVPVDFEDYPRAAKYLESHRTQLEGRKYVIAAGRRWYEIWVPQQPSEWGKPKAVFPDISPTPKFFLDETGGIVDGNCYWFTAEEREHLLLLLAIANSTFILKFYDMMCGNKLYAGRRRFITQYVERFPVPNPDSASAERIVTKMKSLYLLAPHSEQTKAVISEVDNLVWDACSLVEKIAG